MLRSEVDAQVRRCHESMRCVLLPKFISSVQQNMNLHKHEFPERCDFELSVDSSQFKEQIQNYEFELLKLFF